MKYGILIAFMAVVSGLQGQSLMNSGMTSLSAVNNANSWYSINSSTKGGSSLLLFSGLEYPLIKGQIKEYYLSIFPNPASTIVHLNTNAEISDISIITMDGRVVYTQKGSEDIPVEQLPSGMYTIEAANRSKNILITKKLNVVR